MARRASSRRWLRRQATDIFVQRAQQEGYRARAAYKLIEINERDKIFRSRMTIVDLGAAPGSWCQVASRLAPHSQVLALDLLPMDPLDGVDFISGDFNDDEVYARFLAKTGEKSVDLVLSDMAPNSSGLVAIDQPRAMNLAESALDFAQRVLRPDGDVVIKVFQGEGFDEFVRQMRQDFTKVTIRKPKASRAHSREVYIVGRGFSM